VVENDKGKLEVELRGQFWVTASGKKSIADQTERLEDFSLRLRVLVQAKASKWLSLSLQVGQDSELAVG
jgi:hypothetical protein